MEHREQPGNQGYRGIDLAPLRGPRDVDQVGAHNTESVTFAGELAVGVEGRIKPLSGPAQTVRIVEFEPERSLSSEIRLPGAAMTFHYLIEPTDDGVRVRHLITMSGPLSWFYGLLLKGRNAMQLADETERLAALVLICSDLDLAGRWCCPSALSRSRSRLASPCRSSAKSSIRSSPSVWSRQNS